MAGTLNPHQRAIVEAQREIFNRLCAAFRRSGENPQFRLKIEDVKTELNLPANIFSEALKKFADSMAEHTVVVVEQHGERYITLGESAKFNVSDWNVENSRSMTPSRSTNDRRLRAVAAIKSR